MLPVRLWTKLLLAFVAVSCGLTCATLLIVRQSVQSQVRGGIVEKLSASVATFQSFHREREISFARSAALLADLPNLKALMTTQDQATIQDASRNLWTLTGSDLFVLGDRTGNTMAIHTTSPGFTRQMAQESLHRVLQQDEAKHWWFGGGRLYEVFVQPIYFGAPADDNPLGVLAIGREINEGAVREVNRIASSEAAFHYGENLVVSTLSRAQEMDLSRSVGDLRARASLEPAPVELGSERFLARSVELTGGAAPRVHLSVLISYDKATVFLAHLNHLLLALGVLAIGAGSALGFVISRGMTRPLRNLVDGVRALEKGDFGYPLPARSGDEVAEVTAAFDRMRGTLQQTQRQLLAAERLATIGRMASSISHDLRHPLTAVVANAEFLYTNDLSSGEREELYQEIRAAVEQVTDLIDALLEFSRARESLRPVYGRVEGAVEHAVQTVLARPEFQSLDIAVSCDGEVEGWFDPRKLERGFTNMLLNACEAVSPASGRIEVCLREIAQRLEIRVIDNGPGVPVVIRDRLFQPFVSYGKQNGTGLGLSIAQKIFQDHGGDVVLESSTRGRTVFKLTLPLGAAP